MTLTVDQKALALRAIRAELARQRPALNIPALMLSLIEAKDPGEILKGWVIALRANLSVQHGRIDKDTAAVKARLEAHIALADEIKGL